MTQDSPQETTGRPGSALDGLGARAVALAVLLLALGLAGWINREALLPAAMVAAVGGNEAAPAADDPAAQCFAERAAEIDGMQAEGTIDAEQAALFKTRAEALCVAQHGRGAGPPPPPQ